MHRLFVDLPLSVGACLALAAGPTRHIQVWRLQPGDQLYLFNGQGGEWLATIQQIERKQVTIEVLELCSIERELACAVTLAVVMPANERMDWLVEKAAELGAAAVQPLEAQRSVMRLSGERAARRVAHWQAVAQAACEQSGRTRLMRIYPVQPLAAWLVGLSQADTPAEVRYMLSLTPAAQRSSWPPANTSGQSIVILSGPEGGLTGAEEQAASAHGFQSVSLGARTLRADTAPIAALAGLSCLT